MVKYFVAKKRQINYLTIKHYNSIPIGYGMMLPVGHMDFYPNGGSNQPGCPRQSFMNIITEEYEDGTSSKIRGVIFFRDFLQIFSFWYVSFSFIPPKFMDCDICNIFCIVNLFSYMPA